MGAKLSSGGAVGEDFGGQGPKMSSIWYFRGPEGKSIKNPTVLRGFQGLRGPRGASIQGTYAG